MENITFASIVNQTDKSVHNNVYGVDKGAAKSALFYVVLITQVLVVSGMGCVTTIHEIWNHLKKPSSIVIGCGTQFGLLPLCGFGLVIILKLSALQSLSIMIMVCCPGGTISNLYTYLSDGDVPLSIVLTTVSTALAVGMMPLNLWIYSLPWQVADIKLPYGRIAINLIWILVPLAIGMTIKRFWPKIANIFAKVASTVATLLAIASYIPQYIADPDSFVQPWKIWVLSAAIPTLGFTVGYLIPFFFRQPHRLCRTIALETGVQSISLALTIIMTSFPPELHSQLTPFAFLYGVTHTAIGFLVVVVVRLRMRFVKNKNFVQIPEVIALQSPNLTQ